LIDWSGHLARLRSLPQRTRVIPAEAGIQTVFPGKHVVTAQAHWIPARAALGRNDGCPMQASGRSSFVGIVDNLSFHDGLLQLKGSRIRIPFENNQIGVHALLHRANPAGKTHQAGGIG
jgi:hypothetical protein